MKFVLLHSALGLTDGMKDLADKLRARGHEVELPDFYDGRTFDDSADGIAHRDEVGAKVLIGRLADVDLAGKVVMGFSLGAAFAQSLVKPDSALAVLVGACMPVKPGREWCGVPVQLHHFETDSFVDPQAAASLQEAVTASGATFEDFTLSGEGHLFHEPTFAEYSEELTEEFLDRVEARLKQLG